MAQESLKIEKKPEVTPEKADIKEVKPKKKKRSKKFFLLYIIAFIFLVYACYTIINQSVEINEKRAELKKIEDQIKIVEIDNEHLAKVKNYKGDDLKEYIEQIAREDLDYVKNGERVFINVAGD